MRIMVFDVPAENGGALTILNQYYEKAVKNTSNEWIFVISTPNLKDTVNVKVINYPWIKKSWFHRLYFDYFIAHKIVKEYKADEVLSLQNLTIHKARTKQILYLHQPLPFVEKKYKLTENMMFWVYQNIISKMIYKSIVKADKVIVQTNWMKDACLIKVNTNPSKIVIKQPEIEITVKKEYKHQVNGKKIFFYPASGLVYKNHKIIVESVKILKEQNMANFTVVFTLNGNENSNVKKLYKIVQDFDLPIEFIGQISRDKVYEYYNRSILIFPSYIETFGLPLLEAKMHRCPILASDCAFSHEILDGYNNCSFFNPFNAKELSETIINAI